VRRLSFRTLSLIGISVIMIIAFSIIVVYTSDSYTNSIRTKEIQYTELYLNEAMDGVDNLLKSLARVSRFALYDENLLIACKNYNRVSSAEKLAFQKVFQRKMEDIIYLREDVATVGFLDTEKRYAYSYSNLFDYQPLLLTIKNDEGKANILARTENVPAGVVLFGSFKAEVDASSLIKTPFNTYFYYAVRKLRTFYPYEDVGYVVVASPVSKFRDALSLGEDKVSNDLLLDDQNNIVYESSGAWLNKTLNDYSPTILQEISKSRNDFETSINGEKYLVSSLTSEYSGWKLISIRSYDTVFEASRNLTKTIIFSFIAALLAIILLIFCFVYMITWPLKQLTHRLGVTRLDNLNEEIKVTGSREFVILADAYNAMLHKINAMLESEYKTVIMERGYQISLLRAQIKPHFLYNTLDTIRMVAALNGDNETSDMILMLSDFFQKSIVNTAMVPLYVEFAQVKSYISLLKIRYDQIQAEFLLDEAVEKMQIPNFILQPLVENAILHDLKPKGYRGCISVRAEKSADNSCVITIANDGIGLSDKEIESLNQMLADDCRKKEMLRIDEGHIGLLNIGQRLYLSFGDCVKISFNTPPGGGLFIQIVISPDAYTEQEQE